MDNDYFSIDGILAENQKIQCTFKVDIPDMGYLGGGSDRDASTKVPIPIWLAYIVLYSVRNALKAEPRSVKLSALVGAGGLWYGFGKMIMDILSEEQANGMSEVLTQEVIDQAQHFATLGPTGGGGPSGDATQSFREGLDGTEREREVVALLPRCEALTYF
ncbi:hypothetical protein BU15DRAFT_84527 [Melanogaster broomeanus]|nr:hypothetical protein BU15DRAFT_84527 [Melanogaster broomeanus]